MYKKMKVKNKKSNYKRIINTQLLYIENKLPTMAPKTC